MDEADRVAGRIGIIDHGKLIALGTSQALKQQTQKESLEEAFLALTGTEIRDEVAGPADRMRAAARMWRR
jgi:ABC-2 type transport system ATP-binding protein